MSPDVITRQIQFEFVRLAITKAIFEFLGSSAYQTTEKPAVVGINIEVGASVQLSMDRTGAFVTLDIKVTPDQQWQPYRLEVTIAAAFRAQDSSPEDLLTFCRVAAPSILFPYVREIVHRLTMDAPDGPVRLNPMNISQLLNQTEWAVKTDEPDSTHAVSTEPLPPSEQ
jgi:preprotein translocase subunit SecB